MSAPQNSNSDAEAEAVYPAGPFRGDDLLPSPISFHAPLSSALNIPPINPLHHPAPSFSPYRSGPKSGRDTNAAHTPERPSRATQNGPGLPREDENEKKQKPSNAPGEGEIWGAPRKLRASVQLPAESNYRFDSRDISEDSPDSLPPFPKRSGSINDEMSESEGTPADNLAQSFYTQRSMRFLDRSSTRAIQPRKFSLKSSPRTTIRGSSEESQRDQLSAATVAEQQSTDAQGLRSNPIMKFSSGSMYPPTDVVSQLLQKWTTHFPPGTIEVG